jgi:hypothetical protein
MSNETKLALVGSGTMAEAMIKVILEKRLIPPQTNHRQRPSPGTGPGVARPLWHRSHH